MMATGHWNKFQYREDWETRVLRVMDRWVPRLAWVVILAAAIWFGGGVLAWWLRG